VNEKRKAQFPGHALRRGKNGYVANSSASQALLGRKPPRTFSYSASPSGSRTIDGNN